MKLYIFLLFALTLPIAIIKGAVLGIDLGSEFMKVSMISAGKMFLIIENQRTSRKTNTAISFVNKERLYETDAVNKRTKYPENTFTFINKFLGALESDKKTFEISQKYYD